LPIISHKISLSINIRDATYIGIKGADFKTKNSLQALLMTIY